MEKLGNRERIRRCLSGQSIDRVPWFLYFGPWSETDQRWETETGGPVSYERFSYDAGIVSVNNWVNMGFCPAFSKEIFDENDQRVIFRDRLGIVQESIKGRSGIPRIISNPVTCRADWLRLKCERLDPEDPRRFPDNWPEIARQLNEGEKAVQLGAFPYGLFGTLRDLLGVENLLLGFYDDPDLIHEIMDDLTSLWLILYGKICQDVWPVDMVHIWEDMSGKQGSLISPAMVREFMIPNYRRITDFCRAQNIPGFSVDTDGRCDELIEPFMEGGVNALLPFEVAAGNDVVAVRKRYPGLAMLGGIDKRLISAGPVVLETELQRIRPLLSGSGYIPALDHLVPPEVSWSDFCSYSDRLRELIF
jgi:hypothetical protein